MERKDWNGVGILQFGLVKKKNAENLSATQYKLEAIFNVFTTQIKGAFLYFMLAISREYFW